MQDDDLHVKMSPSYAFVGVKLVVYFTKADPFVSHSITPHDQYEPLKIS